MFHVSFYNIAVTYPVASHLCWGSAVGVNALLADVGGGSVGQPIALTCYFKQRDNIGIEYVVWDYNRRTGKRWGIKARLGNIKKSVWTEVIVWLSVWASSISLMKSAL